jgi:energy-coupling factor transport system ATP-binding protein
LNDTVTAERGATRRLSALEITEAAILADISVGLCLLGQFVPAGGVLVAWSVTPYAAVAARHRMRALLAAAATGAVVGLLAGGTGLAVNAVVCATLGALVGIGQRRGWTMARTLSVGAAVLWPAASAIAIGALAVLTSTRNLALAQVRNSWRGVANILRRFQLETIAHTGDTIVSWLITHWWLTVIVVLLIAIEGALAVTCAIAKPVVRALAHAAPLRPSHYVHDTRPASPVPVGLDDVSLRYDGAATPALDHLSIDVPEGRLVTVVGPNGSGKSTFGRVLAGLVPTAGRVDRAGAPGLGEPGGTAMIFQRPEAQVLGMRVRDDVAWSAPDSSAAAIDAALARVGLAGFDDRDTSTLSGGQLQRLAVASALAREPRLIVSDESTAMVDHEGRAELMALYRALATGTTTVVHITHDDEEAARGDVTITLDAGHVRAASEPVRTVPSTTHRGGDRDLASYADLGRAAPRGRASVDLVGVGHVYDAGTPWAHRALHPLDLHIDPGTTVVIEGPNGCGKSTLAWIMAGLLVPSEGIAAVAGTNARSSAHAGLSFQHARLQLQHAHVREEITDAAAVSMAEADAALVAVGLDPAVFAARRIDSLSGGEQRRVAIACLLAQRRDLVVLDEPYAGLDTSGAEALTDVLAGLRRSGVTIVLVTHDHEGTEAIADRSIRLDSGRVVRDTALPPPAPQPIDPGERPPRAPGIHLFRVLPKAGPLHRVSAATKIAALVGIGVTLAISPEWRTIGAIAGALVVAMVVGRIPLGARPRLPRWFLIALLVGLGINFIAGGPPNVHVLGNTIGCGAALDWLRATSIAGILIVSALLVSWTTPFADVPGALAVLTRPAAWLRLPVDEWVTTATIGLRSLPLMMDEVRTLLAARRLRTPPRVNRPRSLLARGAYLLITIEIVGVRRAHDFADALTARGRLTVNAARARPGIRDLCLVVVFAIALVVAFA